MNICVLCDKSARKVITNKLECCDIHVLGVYSKLCESTRDKIAEINPHRIIVNAVNLPTDRKYKDKSILDFLSELQEYIENTPIIYITSSRSDSIDMNDYIRHGVYTVFNGLFTQNVSAIKELIINPKSRATAISELKASSSENKPAEEKKKQPVEKEQPVVYDSATDVYAHYDSLYHSFQKKRGIVDDVLDSEGFKQASFEGVTVEEDYTDNDTITKAYRSSQSELEVDFDNKAAEQDERLAKMIEEQKQQNEAFMFDDVETKADTTNESVNIDTHEDEQKAPEFVFCAYCGAKMKKGQLFCRACGAKDDWEDDTNAVNDNVTEEDNVTDENDTQSVVDDGENTEPNVSILIPPDEDVEETGIAEETAETAVQMPSASEVVTVDDITVNDAVQDVEFVEAVTDNDTSHDGFNIHTVDIETEYETTETEVIGNVTVGVAQLIGRTGCTHISLEITSLLSGEGVDCCVVVDDNVFDELRSYWSDAEGDTNSFVSNGVRVYRQNALYIAQGKHKVVVADFGVLSDVNTKEYERSQFKLMICDGGMWTLKAFEEYISQKNSVPYKKDICYLVNIIGEERYNTLIYPAISRGGFKIYRLGMSQSCLTPCADNREVYRSILVALLGSHTKKKSRGVFAGIRALIGG